MPDCYGYKCFTQKINDMYFKEIKLTYGKTIKKKGENLQIKSSQDAENFLRSIDWNIDFQESFYVLLLNNSNKVKNYAHISTGTMTATMVDVRLLTKYAIESLACAVILAHNHPSGKLKESEADKKITTKIKNCLEVFDIKVLDHIILTDSSYFSFADNGIL